MMDPAQTAVETAAHRIAPVYFPPCALSKAPPIGGPVNAAKDNVPNAIPRRVPNLVMSGVIDAKVEGIKHWNAALAHP